MAQVILAANVGTRKWWPVRANRAPVPTLLCTVAGQEVLSGVEVSVGTQLSFTMPNPEFVDPDDDDVTYAYTLPTKPGGSALTNVTAGTLPHDATITPDAAGAYTVRLTVTDDGGESRRGAPAGSGVATVVNFSFTAVSATANTAPTARLTPDMSDLALNTLINLYSTSSDDPEGDPITWSWRIVSQPVGSAVSLVAGSSASHKTLTGTHAGDYVVGVTVTDDGGAARGVSPATPLASTERTRTYTYAGAPAPTTVTLDLDDHDGISYPWPGEHKDSTTVSLVTDASVRKIRVNIHGDLASRNGGWLAYYGSLAGVDQGVNPDVGEWEDLYLAYKIYFHPGFRFRGEGINPVTGLPYTGGGGGKMGVDIAATTQMNVMSGGGMYFPYATTMRLTYHRFSSTHASMKNYCYMPFFPRDAAATRGWFEAEADNIIEGTAAATAYSSTSYKNRHDFNHHQLGGDRVATGTGEVLDTWTDAQKPRYPGADKRALYTTWGQSRYVGRSGGLGIGSTFTFPIAAYLDVQIHVKMNTFHASNTFTDNDWTNLRTGAPDQAGFHTGAHDGPHKVPNKDGIFEVWAKPSGGSLTQLISKTQMVNRYPKTMWGGSTDLLWNRLRVGAFSGGGYEDCDGTVDIYDVRLSSAPILVA